MKKAQTIDKTATEAYFTKGTTTLGRKTMRNKSEAFANAEKVLLQLGVPDVLPKLREHNIYMRRLILGGSHSVVTYPPLNALDELGPRDSVESLYYADATNLYVHIAFCETNCTFCHYAVEHYRGKDNATERQIDIVSRYLKALKSEMRHWGKVLDFNGGTTVPSVYIGGGTPLVLETTQLLDLIATIRNAFDLAPDVEICVEGSPLTITAPGGSEKLEALKEAGVTRLSFGIQSFDDVVLKYAARGYKNEVARKACEIVGGVFNNWNIDLIQSLREGRPDEVWQNIEAIRQIRPPHITWYHGRFADRPQGHWYRDVTKAQSFEDEYETLLGRMLIWEELADIGYTQTDGNRFVLGEQYVDPFKKSRTSVSSNLLGLGVSSYSHIDLRVHPRCFHTPDGVFFRNTKKVADYLEMVEEQGSAVTTGFGFDPTEHLAASYVIGLRTGRIPQERLEYESLPHTEDVEQYNKLVETLIKAGVLKNTNEALSLTRLGQLFEDEILSLFYSPYVQEVLQK